MPYISPDEKVFLDDLVEELANHIEELPAGDNHPLLAHAGRLNYVVTTLILRLIGPPKYWKIALICGVVGNIKDEFYRRLAAPYEDKKIRENGDVYPEMD